MLKRFCFAFNSLVLTALLVNACQSSLAVGQPSSTASVATSTAVASPTPFPSPTPGPTPTPALLRKPLWTFSTQGEVWSSPTVLDGVIYFGSDDHFLYAVDLATHQPIWKFETGDRVRSKPAIVDSVVYFTSDDNNLYALRSPTGEEAWRFELGQPLMPNSRDYLVDNLYDYAISSPTIADGVVYVGSANNNFYAVDASSGQEKWNFKVFMGPVRSTPAVSDGLVYFGDCLDNIYAVNIETGQVKWRFNTNSGMMLITSPTVADGNLYMGTRGGRGSNPFLFALDARTGQEKWRLSFGVSWVDSSAVVVDGVIYIGSSDWLRLSAIDAATGQIRWQFKGSGYMWCTPAVAGGRVYIGDTDHYFHAVEAISGRELWRVQTGSLLTIAQKLPNDLIFGGVVSSPAVSEDVVYFGGLDGKLYAVSIVP